MKRHGFARALGRLCAGFLVLAAAPRADAATVSGTFTIDFNDVPAGDWAPIPDGYHQFEWTGVNVGKGSEANTDSGYYQGLVSGDYIAYNPDGVQSLIVNTRTVNDGRFHFDSAWFAAAWQEELAISVQGLIDGFPVYSQSVSASQTEPLFVEFNFKNIEAVRLSTRQDEPGWQYVMDNFTYTIVPEPGSLALLGFAGAVLLKRRGRRPATP